MGIKWRIERLNCNGSCLGVGMATARAQPKEFDEGMIWDRQTLEKGPRPTVYQK